MSVNPANGAGRRHSYASPVPGLLDKRLLFVTGKGGVGKTTVAAALGLRATRRGKRTIVCELGASERLAGAFGRPHIGFTEVELRPGLHAISIDPEAALEEYLRDQMGAMSGLLSDNRLFQHFAAATPGLREMVTIGKVWELAQPQRRAAGADPYDLVIVDSPASGHALAVLRTPRTFRDLARAGPVRRQADMIHGLIVDRERTGVVAVVLPEELPVNETLELRTRLTDEVGIELDRVVVNGLWPARFTPAEIDRIDAALGAGNGPAAAALGAALAEHRRAIGQRGQLRRLTTALGGRPPEALPFLFDAELGDAALERLSHELSV